MKVLTCIAPVNIAVIKYWGKRDEELILPINDSISATLCMDQMHAKTTIMASPDFTENKFWLNGVEQSLENPRLISCLKEIRKLAINSKLLDYKIHICSANNFPTAAGLASSAAGYACLVTALANLYNVKTDLTSLARIGSGSACRSIYDGWVHWHMGSKSDGTDSIASQIKPFDHWPEMRILVLVVNDSRKKYSSTSGMRLTVETSELIHYRAKKVVPNRVERMKRALTDKNFHNFAEITMKDSNQFHAVCLDTYPPCVYVNDTSHAIMDLVHVYNRYKGENKVAYTFDAGPNACLFLLERDVQEVLDLIHEVFPTNIKLEDYIRGIKIYPGTLNQNICMALNLHKHNPDTLKYIIQTKVGGGATIVNDDSVHLLDDVGLPKNMP